MIKYRRDAAKWMLPPAVREGCLAVSSFLFYNRLQERNWKSGQKEIYQRVSAGCSLHGFDGRRCAGIPVAAGVWYPVFGLKLSPMLGAAAMSLSSVCVVLNALRLRRFKVKRLSGGSASDNIETPKERKETMKYELMIKGMMCQHCQKHMTDALNAMEGVTAEVNLDSGIATVTSEKEISMDAFEAVVKEAGYELVR